ncbi:hypothetical protein M441DRAFT_52739 [Trichoderma asperellum CBS 433.97]|uniref:Uncharacterized protein n=1 Tax=Trichoderma asperellum (strain ATCC 204424 / CBS 433.97 / NBRC 101777) TaxID=1042311 RepID=A0A2T3YQ29_TRIA4|nr:hypothetical protein M441DRAFT_52739 [Trichoderma asperellum CBS 433.97]PTB34685.1 hypothetical protein M441DRAFT_52739 [Trichoderma asperellum CBS 433.97]
MADFGRCVEKPAKIKRSANAAAGLASRAAAVVAPFTPVLTTTTAAGADQYLDCHQSACAACEANAAAHQLASTTTYLVATHRVRKLAALAPGAILSWPGPGRPAGGTTQAYSTAHATGRTYGASCPSWQAGAFITPPASDLGNVP